jgi:hypothetical protein
VSERQECVPDIDMELSEFRQELADALAEGGTQPLLRLTDEELAVLDPVPDDETIVAAPHLSALGEEQRTWVMATALRSLVAREVVEITNIEEIDAMLRRPDADRTAKVDMRIRPEVDLVLTLRRTAERAVAVRRETADGTAYAYVHIHTPDLLLLERVTAGGMHLFTLAANTGDVATMLRAFVDPFGVADRDGPEHELDPAALDRDHVGPLANVIDNARVVGHLVLLGREPGPMLLTYGTDSAVWTVIVDRPHAPTGIRAQAVGAETLTRRLAGLLV